MKNIVLVCRIYVRLVKHYIKGEGRASEERQKQPTTNLRCDLLYLSEVGQCLECSDPFMLSFRSSAGLVMKHKINMKWLMMMVMRSATCEVAHALSDFNEQAKKFQSDLRKLFPPL